MKNKSLKEIIAGKIPYLIAEIGVNHEGDFNLAKHLIDLAKVCLLDSLFVKS